VIRSRLRSSEKNSSPPGIVDDAERVRVLLIEDDSDAADLLSLILQADGYVVRVAANGLEAFVLLESFRPQVALVDIGLPVIDGYELARRMRVARSCGLIAISGAEPLLDGRDAACFDAYFMKPLDFTLLREAIGRLAHRAK
jgi:DNA-binding response OmpR family regulator